MEGGKRKKGKGRGILVCFAMVLLAAVFGGCGKEDVDKSETVRWMNGTHALRTQVNGWDYHLFGGTAVDGETVKSRQGILAQEWEVTDKDSVGETLDWLMKEGHRKSFQERMELLSEAGISDVAEGERADFIYGTYEVTKEEAQQYAQFYGAYEVNGADTISAWDYSRAMSVLADSYMAGYYTKEETLDKSLEIAGVIQGIYGSWDAFMDSYLMGYEYWSGENSGERKEIYGELKAESDSPYLLDWNLALEKSW